ncbi:YdcF family protein [Candidatus Saccharibacteria bacterium]|nr:YdcF family protein [Candidatus Saccharibacteria bacterium]
MSKIFLFIGVTVASLALIVLGLNVLLTPNDLRFCDEKPNSQEECQAVDVIIAVSGGDTPARAESAVELYRKGWAKHIIFSGAARDPRSQSNAEAMRKIALEAGVPNSAITVEEISKNTTENAIETAKILKKRGAKTAILTTSPYHMRRTSWEFHRAAPEVEFRSKPSDDKYWHLWWLKPSGWWRALAELGGLIMFGIRGIF